MSLKHVDSFPCPRCGKEQQFTIWRYLNIRDNPEELPRVLDGSVFDYICGSCKVSVRVGYPLVYHDPDRRQLLVMTQDRDPEQIYLILAQLFAADLFSPSLSGYQLRGVLQPPDLAEKVLIRMENLDDRVMEIYKSWIFSSYAAEHEGRQPDRILFVKTDTLQFLIFPEEEETNVYGSSYQPESYQETERNFSALFPEGREENLFVDQLWVAKLLAPGDALH